MTIVKADELASIDAVGQADLIRKGELSARDAVQAAIDRIEAVNPRLNAVIDKQYERALARAEEMRGGPFRGVPILIKDVAVKGQPNDLGCEALAKVALRPTETEEFAMRVERAGLVVLGRTNVPELLSAATTESRLHGACRSPWDPTRSCGGSSGGAGSAVAALLVPAAQASDGGGSTRIPAGANGLVGLKPSRGRVTTSPEATHWVDITNTKGWLTRTVRDTAALLDVVAGSSFADTIVAPAPARPYACEVGADPGRLRIGLMRQSPGNALPIGEEAVGAVDHAAELLIGLGHTVEEAHPSPLDSTEHFDLILSYWSIKVAQRLWSVEEKLGRRLEEQELEPTSFRMLTFAREHSMAEFAKTLQKIYEYTTRTLAWYRRGFDLLLTPTVGCPPPKLGAMIDPAQPQLQMQWGAFTPFANLTGQPAISVPLYWTASGLPLGIQLVADVWREDLLIRVASQLEAAEPWHRRIPPIHG
jgi:amidase